MATCKECGTEYLTRECFKCLNKEYMKNINATHRTVNEFKSNKNIKNKNKKHANFTIRLMASLIDTIIIAIPIIIFISEGLRDIILAIITIALWILWNGQSIGKKILNIKIVDTNYNDINAMTAIIRYIGYIISIIPLFMGYAIVPFREDKRALHDLIAKTYVIHTDKENTNTESDTVDKFLAIISIFIGTSLIFTIASGYYLNQVSKKMIENNQAKTKKMIKDIEKMNM